MNRMKMLLAAVLVLMPVIVAADPATQPASEPASQPVLRQFEMGHGDAIRRLDVDGLHRSYLFHVPPKHDATKPMPVVLIYHGAMMNGILMAQFCQMSKKADQAGFVAVYPNGTGVNQMFLFFNSGGMPPTGGPQADDVKFTSKLLDDLGTVVAIDPRRVYATGLSNGGMMCYRLAAELSDRIAAVAPVSGTMTTPDANPHRPVPVLHFHGTADPLVPYGTLNQRVNRYPGLKSAPDSVESWRKIDGCPEQPKITDLPETTHDGTTVRQAVYGPGKDGAEVILVTITGGGHTWPGQDPILQFLGKSTMNISANDMIWDFFVRHPMNGK